MDIMQFSQAICTVGLLLAATSFDVVTGSKLHKGVLLRRRDCLTQQGQTSNPCWNPAPAPPPSMYPNSLMVPRRESANLPPGEDPFMVSMRVEITGTPDNAALAKKLSTLINTPGTDQARIMALSMARAAHDPFPAPPCCGPLGPAAAPGPGSAPAGGPAAVQVLAPAPAPVMPMPTLDPNWGRWQRAKESSMMLSRQAFDIAKANDAEFKALSQAVKDGQRARAEAWYFPPTAPPALAVAKPQRSEEPPTLGRLLFDALINTPAPVQTTLPPLMTTTTYLATTPPPITTAWFRGNGR